MKRLPLLLQVLRQPERLGAASLGDWDLLLLQAGSARLLGALRRLLEEHGLMGQVPPEARTHLDWSQMLSERHRRAVHWEVEQIRRALARLALRPILLKGGAYALAGLPPANGRLFTDIDILVPKDRLDEVEAALMMHGWISSHGDAYDQRYYREWMHELPPMHNLRRGTVIDVHHAILPETAPVRPDPAKLRAAARPIPGDSDFQTLAPADMVLHSATHLFYGEFEHGLRDLVDIDRLLPHFGEEPGFWDGLGARARELALGRPLFYALRMAQRLLGTPVPAAVLADSARDAPGPALLALMDWLFGHALLPGHASCKRRGSDAGAVHPRQLAAHAAAAAGAPPPPQGPYFAERLNRAAHAFGPHNKKCRPVRLNGIKGLNQSTNAALRSVFVMLFCRGG